MPPSTQDSNKSLPNSWASLSMVPHLWFRSLVSTSTVLRQVLLGCPSSYYCLLMVLIWCCNNNNGSKVFCYKEHRNNKRFVLSCFLSVLTHSSGTMDRVWFWVFHFESLISLVLPWVCLLKLVHESGRNCSSAERHNGLTAPIRLGVKPFCLWSLNWRNEHT